MGQDAPGRDRRRGDREQQGSRGKVADLEQLLPELPPLAAQWLTFIRFAAGYYQGEPAELGLGSVPRLLRVPPSSSTRKRADTRLADFDPAPSFSPENTSGLAAPSRLTAEQQAVLDRLTSDELPAKGCAEETLALKGPVQAVAKPWLLHGVTGSGKTEIYLRWFRSLLDSSPEVQVLLLVPEIGLTPSLLTQLRRRFAGESIAVLHSEMPDAARASNWMAAASGKARIVLGTRLAVLAQIPKLGAIVVDEEQDPSFKQQEGIRYSARDMAIARASMAGLPIVLGSATPSLESWNNARTDRYRLLQLTARAGGTDLPTIRVVPLRGAKLDYGLTGAALEAIRGTLGRSEQALVFLNRRGYAPVMSCDACGWLSRCDHCDAFRVLHRLGDPRNPGPRATASSAITARPKPSRHAHAPRAATRTSRRSVAARNVWRRGLRNSFPRPASPALTATSQAAGVRPNDSSRQPTPGRSIC
jgi:primosomal protein N' (replication factor Y)